MKPIAGLMIALIIIFAGCSKEDSDNASKTNRVKITGKLPVTRSATIDGKEATKVLLFNTSGEITVTNIIDGTFTVQVNKDEPVGLIFSNEAKNFLGYLTLGQGIQSLPLNYLNDTTSIVNLGTMSANGNIVSASTDILSQFMKMNTEQIQKYRYASVNFSLYVKNPDTDQNGVIDMLEGKFYRLAFTYFGSGGNYTTTPAKLNAISVDSYRLMFITANESSVGNEITFSSVDGSVSYTTSQKGINPNHTIFYTDLIPINAPQFTQCKVIYKNQQLFFELPAFSGTINNLAYLYPTLSYDSSGKLNKVTWEYYSVSTVAVVDATRLLTDIIIQFDGNSGRIHNSPNLGPENKEYVLTTPLDPSSITNFNMAYNDIFGNHVVIGYRHQ